MMATLFAAVERLALVLKIPQLLCHLEMAKSRANFYPLCRRAEEMPVSRTDSAQRVNIGGTQDGIGLAQI